MLKNNSFVILVDIEVLCTVRGTDQKDRVRAGYPGRAARLAHARLGAVVVRGTLRFSATLRERILVWLF